MLKTLNKILTSNNVVDRFYDEYNGNSQFYNWLNSILPEVKKCEEKEQNNPWHKYNVLGHILHSVEEMNKQTVSLDEIERKMLAFVMFLHDIGKPDKHIVRMKDGVLIDSFFNHNIRSEEIARKFLPQVGFNDKEVNIMCMLILKHDIFMFIKEEKANNPHWKTLTREVVEDEISELNQVGDGQKLMKDLVMVGRSDSLAQNEKMTKAPLKMLDKFERILEEILNEKIDIV